MTAESKMKLGQAMIAFAMTIAGALGGAGAFVATTRNRLCEIETRFERVEDRLLPAVQDIRERVIRIETRMEAERQRAPR